MTRPPTPTQPESVYTGDAGSKTLSLYPTSPGLGTQPCPFCAKQPAGATANDGNNIEQISLLGSETNDANLTVTDDAGRRLGVIDGSLVNEIPGARVDAVSSNDDWTNKTAPDFFVPADKTYTIRIDGSDLTAPDTETLALTGPSYDLSIDSIPVTPGAGGHPGRRTRRHPRQLYEFKCPVPEHHLRSVRQSGRLLLRYPGCFRPARQYHQLRVATRGRQPERCNTWVGPSSSINFKMNRETEQGVQAFAHNAIALSGQDKDQLQFGGWTGSTQGIPLVITHNGQQSTQVLADQSTG